MARATGRQGFRKDMEIEPGAALRIGLAARALPGVDLRDLVSLIGRKVQGPVTESGLRAITVTDLKTGALSADGEEDGEDIGIGLAQMKEAVRILWGEDEDTGLPDLVPSLGRVPGVVRVAVASNEGEQLDGHFGACLRYLVYELSTDDIRLVEIRSALDADLAEDRNAYRADLVADCHLLVVVSIGGPAAAKVVRAGVYPLKTRLPMDARTHMQALQEVMRSSPPPWMAKAMGRPASSLQRFISADTAEVAASD